MHLVTLVDFAIQVIITKDITEQEMFSIVNHNTMKSSPMSVYPLIEDSGRCISMYDEEKRLKMFSEEKVCV